MLQKHIPLGECILQLGPFRVTLSDLLTTLSPGTLTERETKKITASIPTFTDGWLTDTESSFFHVIYSGQEICIVHLSIRYATCFSFFLWSDH